MTSASAFCPAGISSFFQAETTESPPTTIEGACRIGARGGGFILEKGVYTQITVTPASTNQVEVTINGQRAPEAKVTQDVCQLLLHTLGTTYRLQVHHKVEVPIGAGYGASAAGAVSTAMALNSALKLNLTLNRIGQFAHFAEIRCATGLGSVSGVIRGGMILILEPGAPGYDRVDWIPLDPAYRIVTASFAPISKTNIIFSKKALQVVNREGQRVLNQVQENPSPTHFMRRCLGFAKKVGFLTPRVANVLERVQKAGAIGATQNMIGEAFHALVHMDSVDSVTESLEHLVPLNSILVSRVFPVGPRYT